MLFQLMDKNTDAHKCTSLLEINQLHAKASVCAHSNTHPTYRDAHTTQRHILPTDTRTQLPTFPHTHKSPFTYRHTSLGRCPGTLIPRHTRPHVPQGLLSQNLTRQDSGATPDTRGTSCQLCGHQMWSAPAPSMDSSC